jgi:CheY-like chemotaxis protein
MAAMRILLVEDNEDDRFLTIRQLRKLPVAVEIEIARNGDEALQRLTGNEAAALPAVVLLDLQLPKLDGIAVLQKIRDRYDQGKLPVVILSSSDNPGDLVVCQELGISGYLAKPLQLPVLQEILTTLR